MTPKNKSKVKVNGNGNNEGNSRFLRRGRQGKPVRVEMAAKSYFTVTVTVDEVELVSEESPE
jgi:hypothetical protein